jgi:hypothetical protein
MTISPQPGTVTGQTINEPVISVAGPFACGIQFDDTGPRQIEPIDQGRPRRPAHQQRAQDEHPIAPASDLVAQRQALMREQFGNDPPQLRQRIDRRR